MRLCIMGNFIVQKGHFIYIILTAFLMIFIVRHERIFAATNGKVNLELWTLTLDNNKTSGTLMDYKCDDSLKDIIVPNAADFIGNDLMEYENLTKIDIAKKVM